MTDIDKLKSVLDFAECLADQNDLEQAGRLLEWILTEIEQSVDVDTASKADIRGRALRNLGNISCLQDNHQAALERYEEARGIYAETFVGSREFANLLADTARMHQVRGQRDEALSRYAEAQQVLEEIAPQSADLAGVLASIGRVQLSIDEFEMALSSFERAQAIWEEVAPGSEALAAVLTNLGWVHLSLTEFEEALSWFERAQAIWEEVAPGSEALAAVLTNMGWAHHALGAFDEALSWFGRAKAIREEFAPGSEALAAVLNSIGWAYHALGALDEALSCFRQVLAIREELDPGSEALAGVLANIGIVLRDRGEFDDALSWFRQAQAIWEELAPGSEALADVLSDIGGALCDRGEFDEALSWLGRARAIWAEVAPGSEELADVLANMGFLHWALGRSELAADVACEAVRIVESVRVPTGFPVHRKLGADHRCGAYQLLVQCLSERETSRTPYAIFRASEGAKGRRIADVLSERTVDHAPRTEQQRHLVNRERRLRAKLANAKALLTAAIVESKKGNVADGEVQRTRCLVLETEQELRQAEQEIWDIFPDYAAMAWPRPLDLEQAQEFLGPDTLLLEYAFGADRVVCLAVRHNSAEPVVLRRPGGPAYISPKQLAEFIVDSTDPDDRRRAARAREVLSVALLDAIPDTLWQGARRLLVVPEGCLFQLPFESLVNPRTQKLLDEEMLIGYAPSLGAYARLRDLPNAAIIGSKFVAFGLGFDDAGGANAGDREVKGLGTARPLAKEWRRLPAIPQARVTARALGELFGEQAQCYIDGKATKKRVKQACGTAHYLHFATHGLVDDDLPLYSGIVLAAPEAGRNESGPYDILQVHEMFGLGLSAELVVVPAGSGIRQRTPHRTGLACMIQALLYSGTRCLVLSIWPVSDLAATKALMESFYQELLKGADVAQALRLARARVRDTPDHDHSDPYLWAGFVPIGMAWR